jgi:hypothetical protein
MPEYVVSTTGDNDAAGTTAAPFRTIERGIQALCMPGDVLVIRGGVYSERMDVIAKKGGGDAPIVIRGEAGEQVFIDGPEPVDVSGQPAGFRVAANSEWRPAKEVDPHAHQEEYISTRVFPGGETDGVRHGAFLDRPFHTRLITYSRLDDLRAVNQRFGRLDMADKSLPSSGDPVVSVSRTSEGMKVTFDEVANSGGLVIPKYKRPWTYLGPGLYQDCGGWIHVRLSHTTNDTAGIADYDGETDPRALGLALSTYVPPTMKIKDCSHVRIENLNVRFGGNRTVRIDGCSEVVLDHVTVWAGAAGVFVGEDNNDVHLLNCVLDGGLPPWLFRSDIKDGYKTLTSGNEIVSNDLAKGTMDSLLSGGPTNVGTVFEYCEFVGAHDMALFGQGTSFHHNWVHNIHDDALIVDLKGTKDLDVHQNAITKCLVALSFARTGLESIGGPRRVHRNLIDLREPTAGVRPRPPGHLVDKDDLQPHDGVYRYGQLYKGNKPDGPMDFFHNTCLVRRQNALAGYLHFRDSALDNGVRRSVNNIFVDVEPVGADAGYATTVLPDPGFAGPTDANCYRQLGGGPPVRHLGWAGGVAQTYPSLDAYREGQHFKASQAAYPPGFENSGTDKDPQFRSIAPDGSPSTDDDLRLRDGSPAAKAGLQLTGPPTGIIDPLAQPDGPAPDLGCYPPAPNSPVLEVGVKGRRKFPQHPR